jgi:hypothetical protein
MSATPKLSKAGKMPCRSWSLEAKNTCPGSIDTNTKELVDACKGCYAATGNYRFPNVKKPRIHNKEDWKQSDWVAVMVKELDNDRYFRWFDSGDVYHPELAKKMYQVMVSTPWVKHWLPTRSHKLKRILPILEKMKLLPNVMVRYSSDSVRGEFNKDIHGSAIVGEDQLDTKGVTICHAYTNEGKCGDCRACWDKSVSTVAYVQHGVQMKKVNNNIIASAS